MKLVHSAFFRLRPANIDITHIYIDTHNRIMSMSTWLLLCFQTIHKIVPLFSFSVFRIDIYFLMISMG